jgi:hypothetical protein
MEFQMMQKIQDDEARILAELHETQISGVVLGGFREHRPPHVEFNILMRAARRSWK